MSEHKLHVYHNSQDISYRSPFGAVPAGQEIMIRILVKSEQPSSEVVLRLWERSNEEKIIPMALINENPDNGNRVYETFVTPEHHQVLWYYFKIQYEGTFYYYSRPDNLYGGAGCLSKRPHHSYQITVYRVDFNVPKWYRQGVMYQIFPDRFRKGEDMQTEAFIKNDILNKDIIFHDNWDDVPNYLPDPLTGKILNNDFFGGNIQGIIEKLDYLKDLGITIIYLNPIFKSYSNHRYDTGDYLSIDPMLGDSEAFRFLCNQAGKRGIAIILDGVFSHTGSDSIYFNKNGNYPGIGAWQSKDSPYYPWYRFQKHPDEYDCWWGIRTLPNVDEMESSYMDFIIRNEDSVIKHWLRNGASGWRLDVVDELPDKFIKELRKAVKEINPEAVIIGEVWEDASNKISYGTLREYLLGEELDVVMNYPFRSMLLNFLLGSLSGEDLRRGSLTMYENYPKEAFYGAMNLIGTHDVTRLRTILGEAPIPAETGITSSDQATYRMSEEQKVLADKRQRLAVIMQMTLPGVPSIYYGDEAGMEGYSDPHNRRTYPWGKEDQIMIQWYKRLIGLRNQRYVLQSGEYIPIAYQDGLFAYIRIIENNRDVFGMPAEDDFLLIIVNRDSIGRELAVDLSDYPIQELKNVLASEGTVYQLDEGLLTITLDPMSGVILDSN
jgi:cyclomaltodextrinase